MLCPCAPANVTSDRDPEAEAEEKVEEEKLIEAEPEPVAETWGAPAGGFEGAATGEWGAAEGAAATGEWAAAEGAAPASTTEWGAEATTGATQW